MAAASTVHLGAVNVRRITVLQQIVRRAAQRKHRAIFSLRPVGVFRILRGLERQNLGRIVITPTR